MFLGPLISSLRLISHVFSLLKHPSLNLTELLLPTMSTEDDGYKIALQEAMFGAAEGGIPVGACIVSKDGKVLGQGRNTR